MIHANHVESQSEGATSNFDGILYILDISYKTDQNLWPLVTKPLIFIHYLPIIHKVGAVGV